MLSLSSWVSFKKPKGAKLKPGLAHWIEFRS